MSACPDAAPARGRPKVRAYLDLGKLGLFDLWLGFFAGASLLPMGTLRAPRTLGILGLVLLFGVLVIALTCCLDDVTGARDGVDQANHRGAPRWGVRKPLLEGAVTERQALRLAAGLAAGAAACLGGVLALAWPLPAWVVLAMTAIPLLVVNYSSGLRLSYRGAGEIVVFAGGLGSALIPFALIMHSAPPLLLFCGVLVGAWHAQVVLCSNAHDAAGDRATGRLTLAARVTPAGYRVLVTAVFAAVWSFTAAAAAAGAAPLPHLLLLAPVCAMQAAQLWIGVRRGRWLDARRAGFRVLGAGVLALTIANLLLGGV